jgi:hypothetical protein
MVQEVYSEQAHTFRFAATLRRAGEVARRPIDNALDMLRRREMRGLIQEAAFLTQVRNGDEQAFTEDSRTRFKEKYIERLGLLYLNGPVQNMQSMYTDVLSPTRINLGNVLEFAEAARIIREADDTRTDYLMMADAQLRLPQIEDRIQKLRELRHR